MRYAPGEARDWVRAALYLAVLYTPFDQSGALHQEFWTLTDVERLRLVEVVLETVAGQAPVVVGCTDPSAAKAVAYAQHPMAGPLGMRTGPVRPGVAPCDPLELAECTACCGRRGCWASSG
jgi:hypothetical protein